MKVSNRQYKILKYVITEFLKTAEPVGSQTIFKKYKINASPATLRYEMCRLANDGFLYKEHSSSGRIPTTIALRLFLNEMLKEEEIEPAIKAKIKEELFQKRFDKVSLIKKSVKTLSNISKQFAIAMLNEITFMHGLSYWLENRELNDIDLLQKIIDVIESETLLEKLFKKFGKKSRLTILIGEETGISPLKACSIIFSQFCFYKNETGYIGVIGPRTLNYQKVIPAVKMLSSFFESLTSGWR